MVIYLRSLLFIFAFVLTLIIFDILMRLVRPFSYEKFLSLQFKMCKVIRLLLTSIAKVKFGLPKEIVLPKDIPVLVISNHQSMYDVSLLTELFKDYHPRFISKKELGAWVPAISFIARNNKSALIDRNNRQQAIFEIQKVTEQIIKDKGALIIFPEGTRAKNGVLKPFKIAGLLSILDKLNEATVVSVGILNSWKVVRHFLFPIEPKINVIVKILKVHHWNRTEKNDSKEFIQEIEREIKDFVLNN